MNNMQTHENAAFRTEEPRLLYLSALLERGVIDAGGQVVGRISDVVVRQQAAAPLVTGLVADIGARRLFIHAEAVASWESERLTLASAQVDLRPFERRSGEIMLRTDVLAHRLVDLEHARLVRAFDIPLSRSERGWEVSGIDVYQPSRLRLPGRPPRHSVRVWRDFALVGSEAPISPWARRAWLRRLKPAEIADLVEEATDEERREILEEVHSDRELEADVFEELEDDEQSQLLALRSDKEAAEVLAHMQADDAADAIMELPPERRQPILEQLPERERTKVTMLLGFHAASAGGLMGTDFLTVSLDAPIGEALATLRHATGLQGQALTSVYCVDDQGRLEASATLVELLQADSAASLRMAAELDPVRVGSGADLLALTLLMADHNLLTLPVVDEDEVMIGLITVDDVLEALVPENWRRRAPAPRAPRSHGTAETH